MRKEGYALDQSNKKELIPSYFFDPMRNLLFYFKISLKISSCSARWSVYTTSVQTVRWHVLCDGSSHKVKLLCKTIKKKHT